MSTTIRARKLPYDPPRGATFRICARCGIQFRIGQPSRDGHLRECRDCREMDT